MQLAELAENIKLLLSTHQPHVVRAGEMELVGRGDTARVRPRRRAGDGPYYSTTCPFVPVPPRTPHEYSQEEIKVVLLQFIELADDDQRVAIYS